jgi:hypothetical protein
VIRRPSLVAPIVAGGLVAGTLASRPLVWGPIYGILVFFTMRDVVLPLAGVPAGRFSWGVFANGIAIHVLGIGIPIAVIARRWRSGNQRP